VSTGLFKIPTFYQETPRYFVFITVPAAAVDGSMDLDTRTRDKHDATAAVVETTLIFKIILRALSNERKLVALFIHI